MLTMKSVIRTLKYYKSFLKRIEELEAVKCRVTTSGDPALNGKYYNLENYLNGLLSEQMINHEYEWRIAAKVKIDNPPPPKAPEPEIDESTLTKDEKLDLFVTKLTEGMNTKQVCENRYKTSRISAGYSQFDAADMLHISERSLSDYETGKSRVPDDVVAAMVELYSYPILAFFHMKLFSPLGKLLPDIPEAHTQSDMALQAILARDELDPAVDVIKRIISEGYINDDNRPRFRECIDTVSRVNGKLLSVVTYANTVLAQKEVMRYG